MQLHVNYHKTSFSENAQLLLLTYVKFKLILRKICFLLLSRTTETCWKSFFVILTSFFYGGMQQDEC